MARLLVEYGVLALLAGALGSCAAAVSKYGLEITWWFVLLVNLLGIAMAPLLVLAFLSVEGMQRNIMLSIELN